MCRRDAPIDTYMGPYLLDLYTHNHNIVYFIHNIIYLYAGTARHTVNTKNGRGKSIRRVEINVKNGHS